MSSRESDNASPPPRRSAGDAYPSGTPPYGTPHTPEAFGADGFGPAGTGFPGGLGGQQNGPGDGGQEASATDSGPKTETTLTTRVRINIPGSRPIPPVVVRSPVKDQAEPESEQPGARSTGARGSDDATPRHRSAGPASPVLGVMDTENRPSTPPNLPPEWQTPDGGSETGGRSSSDGNGEWFRPRKKPRPGEAAAAAAQSAPTLPAPSAPSPSPSPEQRPVPQPGTGLSPFDEPVRGGLPDRSLPPQGTVTGTGSTGSFPRPAGPSSPRPTGAPASPFGPASPHGRSEDDAFPGAQDAFPPGSPAARKRPAPRTDGPFPQSSGDPFPQSGGGPFQPQYQNDPFETRPVSGTQSGMPYGAALGGTAAADRFAPPNLDADPEATAAFPAPVFPAPASPTAAFPAAARPADPPATAVPDGRRQGGAKRSRQQKTEQEPSAPAAAGFREQFRPGPATAPKAPTTAATAAAAPEPAARNDKKTSAAAPRRRSRRVRKLLVTAIGALVGAAGVAYGAGLMLNQADVPKGTVVLGTDIGGSSRDAAVHTLDATVAELGRREIDLRLGGKTVALDPTAAGLSFDTTATVDSLTHHSYNPMDVMDSLTGKAKDVPPQVKIDPAKLRAALQQLGAGAGQGPREGYVSFTASGKAVPVLPKVGKSVDVDSAVGLVEKSYRARAAGVKSAPIDLQLVPAQPKASSADIRAAAKGLGKEITEGGIVTVKRGNSDFAAFQAGPYTFSTSLRLVPDATGKIAPRFDLAALKDVIGTAFDGYEMKHGAKTGPITTQDVADAIISGLDKTGDDRTVVLPVVTTG